MSISDGRADVCASDLGAAALSIASKAAVEKYGLTSRARILGAATAGVPPRGMGIGPAPASKKLLERLGLSIGDMDVVELNEAFAAQGLAVMRELGLADDAAHLHPNGVATALDRKCTRLNSSH